MDDLVVTGQESGLSALEVLGHRFEAAPESYLRRLLRSGRVTRRGTSLTAASLLREGDHLALPGSRRLAEFALLSELASRILVETPEALIVDKPAGLAVHRGAGHHDDNLTRRIERLLDTRRQRFRCAPVHRLDRETSGPVLFGKGRRALGAFGAAFMAGAATKVYLALVAGHPPRHGLLEDPVPVRRRHRHAATRFRRLACAENFALLELELLTGRRHQIRRHLAGAGHPLAGDERYGGPSLPGLGRLFLHCRTLSVDDPFGGGVLAAGSPLPAELGTVLDRLGLTLPEGALRPVGSGPALR